MIPIIIAIVFFSIAVLFGLWKIYRAICDSWPFYHAIIGEVEGINKGLNEEWAARANLEKEVIDMNRKLDELNAFMKTTFNKEFASKVEDIIKAKHGAPKMVEVLCDDGKKHLLPEDPAW